MFDVISIGSATLDIFLKSSQFHLTKFDGKLALCEAFNQKIDVENAEIASGGGATNTAVGFARKGFRTACVVEIGKDFAGDIVLQDLQREKVDISFVVSEKNEKTAIGVLLISEHGERTALVYRGASRMVTVDDIPWSKLQSRWIHLSSVGNAEVIEKIFSHCIAQKISLSWNPGNWEIKQIQNRTLKPNWKAVTILFTNREEMGQLSGIEQNDEIWKSEWCFAGPKITVMTDGKNGGRYCKNGSCFFFTAERVQTVQETGAGDAFACGVVSGQLAGKSLIQSIELGKSNAAGVISQLGAKKGLVSSI